MVVHTTVQSWQVHPAKFTRALMSCAESKGATVRIGTVKGVQTATDTDGHTHVTGEQTQPPALPGGVQASRQTLRYSLAAVSRVSCTRMRRSPGGRRCYNC